jgi:hypothetical protein
LLLLLIWVLVKVIIVTTARAAAELILLLLMATNVAFKLPCYFLVYKLDERLFGEIVVEPLLEVVLL